MNNPAMIKKQTIVLVILLFPVLFLNVLYAQLKDHLDYTSIQIGKQLWMGQNLNEGRFRNGDSIPEAKSAEEWINAGNAGKPAWCYYENSTQNGSKYGKLYNWFAINDPRGLAPEGWHVPTDDEWRQVTLFLGGEDAAGTKMKYQSGWTGEGNGTNESGFSGLPAGSRDRFGKFSYKGSIAYWWCSSDYDADFAWYRVIDEMPWYVYRTYYYKQNGYSLRCIKD
jgi:uncharacterized protein (TIGR02145 family)